MDERDIAIGRLFDGLKITDEIRVHFNGLIIHGIVVPGDNPCPWIYNPDKYGVVSEWTNRPMRIGEKLLHEVQTFAYSAAGRGKLFYDTESSKIKFARNTGTRYGDHIIAMSADFDRLQAWCQGRWYYVDLQVQVYDDGQPLSVIVLGSQGMGPFESDDHRTIMQGLERCARDALDEAYQRVWAGLSGDPVDVPEKRRWSVRPTKRGKLI